MADTYIDQKHRQLHVPILVLCGSQDYEISDEDILEWEDYTTSNFSTAIIEGGHLFLDTNTNDVISELRAFIKKELSVCPDHLT